jgi:hypothetical protein
MYRLFSMDKNGSLYELCSRGWVRGRGMAGTNFPSLFSVRVFLDKAGTPPLPSGRFMQDTYIARVDPAGLIVKTFPLTTATNECEG